LHADETDRRWMAVALEQAALAARAGEVPIGAVVVQGGELIAAAHNRVEALRDPTAHAEVLAIRAACRALGRWRLLEATLYVTIEPCPMCAMAAVLGRLERIVYGAPDPKFGGLGSQVNLFDAPRFNHTVRIQGGVAAEEAAALLKRFFAGLRKR